MSKKPKIPLHQVRLFKVSSPDKLASILGLSVDELRGLTHLDPAYREFDIEKKGGGLRHCEDPVPSLKAVHQKITKMLSRIEAPDFLYCPVKERCYVSNAAAHRHNRVVHCLDIRKFFPSTPTRRVFWFFHTVLQCRRDVAGLLAELTTFQGRLPTGSPLSPILAYFSFFDMWAEIDDFCRLKEYTVTVYIDDVTISGAKVPKQDIWSIKKIIHRYGLQYHKEKSFIDRPAEITGVIVKSGRLFAPHRQHHKKMRATEELRALDEENDELKNKVAGLDGQIRQILRVNASQLN